MKGGGDKYDWMEVNSQMKQCMISLSRIRYMIYTLLRNKGDISMAEAIISRRGWSSEGKPPPTPTFVLTTKTFTSNTSWVVPNHNSFVSVRIFGGGGGGGYSMGGGGGGGWMNNSDLTLSNGATIRITIGDGGTKSSSMRVDGNAGGTSSFGSWLSANGGSGGGCYMFGDSRGGYGGSGGGGQYGGRGWQFGGGGGHTPGIGGPWGGNAGENGINTMANSLIPSNDRGPGKAGGSSGLDGGGGYGANGGNSDIAMGGGGGWGKSGYGGNGGGSFDTEWGSGGGGGYGRGGSYTQRGQYGGGGGSNGNGGDGICIVQYYAES